MGVDPRRPLAGFVIVAVLCAVLMTISISRGFGVDLVHPGRPIAERPARTPVEPLAERPAAPAPVTIPDELSAQPLAAVVVGGPAHSSAQEAGADSGAELGGGSDGDLSGTAPDTTGDEHGTRTDETSAGAERRRALKALRDAAKARRAADRDAVKARRDAAKAQRAAERDASKAQRAAERDAAKAARKG